MAFASEDVTKTWVVTKAALINNRPKPSRFSFVVCLSVVFSGILGFLGGIIVSNLTLGVNYSSVYENLLAELEEKRAHIESERNRLAELESRWQSQKPSYPSPTFNQVPTQGYQQAVFGVLNSAIESFQKNDLASGCNSLKTIPNDFPDTEWGRKALLLYDKKCRH